MVRAEGTQVAGEVGVGTPTPQIDAPHTTNAQDAQTVGDTTRDALSTRLVEAFIKTHRAWPLIIFQIASRSFAWHWFPFYSSSYTQTPWSF